MPPARCIVNPTNTEVAQLSTKSTTWRRAIGAPGIHPDGEQPKTALWLWVREITWYLYTRGVRGRMKAKQRRFKVTRELCHEWYHHFRHHVHDGHWTGEFATGPYESQPLKGISLLRVQCRCSKPVNGIACYVIRICGVSSLLTYRLFNLGYLYVLYYPKSNTLEDLLMYRYLRTWYFIDCTVWRIF